MLAFAAFSSAANLLWGTAPAWAESFSLQLELFPPTHGQFWQATIPQNL